MLPNIQKIQKDAQHRMEEELKMANYLSK